MGGRWEGGGGWLIYFSSSVHPSSRYPESPDEIENGSRFPDRPLDGSAGATAPFNPPCESPGKINHLHICKESERRSKEVEEEEEEEEV